MKLVVDTHIPYLEGVFPPQVEVVRREGDRFTAQDIADADALIVRTRTRCNQTLLEGSRVRLIATATIGTDHVDLDYCRRAGIEVVSAAGCNAKGVKQYIAAALVELRRRGCDYRGRTLGIIGVGNVGSQVDRIARQMGMKTLLNDPPRALRDSKFHSVLLKQVLAESDFVTLHVPLTRVGENATYGMADARFFAAMKPEAAFLNASRGEVVDDPALLDALKSGHVAHAVLDVWNDEPHLNRELLAQVDLATPHIAGYSAQGKANGTARCVWAVSQRFGLGLENWYPTEVEPNRVDDTLLTPDQIERLIAANYAITEDDRALREAPERFEELRNHYHYRNECF